MSYLLMNLRMSLKVSSSSHSTSSQPTVSTQTGSWSSVKLRCISQCMVTLSVPDPALVCTPVYFPTVDLFPVHVDPTQIMQQWLLCVWVEDNFSKLNVIWPFGWLFSAFLSCFFCCKSSLADPGLVCPVLFPTVILEAITQNRLLELQSTLYFTIEQGRALTQQKFQC